MARVETLLWKIKSKSHFAEFYFPKTRRPFERTITVLK